MAHSPHLPSFVPQQGRGSMWEIEMKEQTCKWGRLWHKCSPGCQHGAEVGWGQGDSGGSGTQGQPRWVSCWKCRTQQACVKMCNFTLWSVRKLRNSVPCLLPAPSASTFRLSFPFYTLSPHCQVPSIPSSPMDECCSQHPMLCKTRQIHQWPQRHLLSLKASHKRENVHSTLNTSLPPFTQVIPFGLHIFKDLN